MVSGSFEERREYAGDILGNQDCRIVLCSLQYIKEVSITLNYLMENDLLLYIHWLNPGYNDQGEVWDPTRPLKSNSFSFFGIRHPGDGKTWQHPGFRRCASSSTAGHFTAIFSLAVKFRILDYSKSGSLGWVPNERSGSPRSSWP